ncbi:MAG: transcription antitermination protein NusB [Holosporales bacterium]|nr:transcription antitermination protein NusB [Holosporales bacterium]
MSEKKILSKRLSRVAAVQIMYQINATSSVDIQKIINNFIEHYVKQNPDCQGINYKFLESLVGRFSESLNLDEIINNNLEYDKSLSNAPIIGVSIIKVAIIEMIFEKTDIPVIINEYIEIAKSFVDYNFVHFINAILEKISKRIERKCQAKA